MWEELSRWAGDGEMMAGKCCPHKAVGTQAGGHTKLHRESNAHINLGTTNEMGGAIKSLSWS